MVARLLFALILCPPLLACAQQNCFAHDPLLTKRMEALLSAALPVDRATTAAQAAAAWFRLNQRADEFAKDLSSFTRKLPVREAKALCADAAIDGSSLIPIQWCEFSGRWVAAPTGYLIYSQFLPNGPLAEIAWWFGRLASNPQGCGGDLDGDSREEGAYYAKLYAAFLKRFPHGKYSAEAREALAGFQEEADNGTEP